MLSGSLALHGDGRFVEHRHTRLTLFGDTREVAASGTGQWSQRADTVWFDAGDPRNPPGIALVRGGTLTTYAGGLTSGGTAFRYTRE